jgi:hypothetical protein
MPNGFQQRLFSRVRTISGLADRLNILGAFRVNVVEIGRLIVDHDAPLVAVESLHVGPVGECGQFAEGSDANQFS